LKANLGRITSWNKGSQRKTRQQQARNHIDGVFKNRHNVVVIPPKKDRPSETAKRKLRTAFYCRVSSDEEKQLESYGVQVNHYQKEILRHPEWELVDIYADEEKSGTSIELRPDFQRMIADCRAGRIDQIITKCGTRFSRNLGEALILIRELNGMKPPVNVIFEIDNYESQTQQSEAQLISILTSAQSESERRSRQVKWSRKVYFEQGVPLIPTHNLLGYTKNEQGELVIVKREAKVVRYIYDSYLQGSTTGEIAKFLTAARIPTVMGRSEWQSTGVLSILRNEKYVGDVLMQKTYTWDLFKHRVRKNDGDLPQFYLKDHHQGIVSRKAWNRAQDQLAERLYQRKSGVDTPAPRPIRSGHLKGFVCIDPHWGYKAHEAYLDYAAEHIPVIPEGYEPKANGKPDLIITQKHLAFTGRCLAAMDYPSHVRMLVHPQKRIFALQACKATDEMAFPFAKPPRLQRKEQKCYSSIKVRDALYGLLDTRYEIGMRFCAKGSYFDGRRIMLFDINEAWSCNNG